MDCMESNPNEETPVTPTETPENPEAPAVAEAPTQPKRPFYKRLWFWIVSPICAILVILLLFCLIAPGAVAKRAINTTGAQILNVDKMHVGSVYINPFSLKMSMRDLVVGKPLEGSFSEDMIHMKRLSVKISIEGNKIIIDDLELKGLVATLEKPLSGKSNFEVLLDSVSSTAEEAQKQATESSGNEEPQEIYIGARKMFIDSANIRMIYAGVPTPLPPVTVNMENVGLDSDLSPTEFGMLVAANFLNAFNRIDYSGLGNSAVEGVDAGLDAGMEGVNTGINAVKGLFGGSDEKSEGGDK